MARLDYFTQPVVAREYFSDFLSSFDKSPLSNDLARLVDGAAVKQSVRNLVLTDLGERLFQPNIGSTVYRSLFEPFSGFTAEDIKQSIINTIKHNENRVDSSSLTVTAIQNDDQNALTINVVFFLLNSPQPMSVDLVIQRVR
jgi:phage baseplate assembly protein W